MKCKQTLILVTLLTSSFWGAKTTHAKQIDEPIIPAIAGVQSKAILPSFAKNQYDLGLAYYDGVKIPRNPAKAIEWFIRASEKNHAPSKVMLAKMLLVGDGIRVDQARAVKLLQQASGKGNLEAKTILKRMSSKDTPIISNIDRALFVSGVVPKKYK